MWFSFTQTNPKTFRYAHSNLASLQFFSSFWFRLAVWIKWNVKYRFALTSEWITVDTLCLDYLNNWLVNWTLTLTRFALTGSFEPVNHTLQTRSDQITWINESLSDDLFWSNHLSQWIIHYIDSHTLIDSHQVIWISEWVVNSTIQI